MRIGFVVNRLRRLRSSYTTTHLASAAVRAGIRPLFIETDGFTLDPSGRVLARAHAVPAGHTEPEDLTRAARRGSLPTGLVDLEQLDAILLRNNPVQRTVLDFVRVLRERGILVLNDPDGVAAGAGKLTLECLPDELKLRTLITRDARVLMGFLGELGGPAVLKPVRGYGGKGVILVDPARGGDIDRAVGRAQGATGGYVVAQELAPGAERGDKRILLVDGEPVGCYVRMRRDGEFRHNIHVGGRAVAARVDDADRAICAALCERLRADGIFLAGLDVIGGRAVEVNVVAPGGVANIERTAGIPVADPIVHRLRQRIAARRDEMGSGPRREGTRGPDQEHTTTEDGPLLTTGPNG